MIYDPRLGDIESDISSPKKNSLWALAGSLFAEISFPKLLAAWLLLIGLPGLALGLAPIVFALGLVGAFDAARALQAEAFSVLALILVAVGALAMSRRLFRLAEHNFWALNALGVQPFYAAIREILRQTFERRFAPGEAVLRARAGAAILAGLLVSLGALGVFYAVWPKTVWIADPRLLIEPIALARAALANACALVALYVAGAGLFWGLADGLMDQPRDFSDYDATRQGEKIWRVAHLSDLHAIGENYGFRIESGRAGPRGNQRLQQVFALLDQADARQPLDVVLATGDLTDAGLAAEWADFDDALQDFPNVARKFLALPGNHDLNIVDKSNPARLELPGAPHKMLRKLRLLAMLDRFQGARCLTAQGERLSALLAERGAQMQKFFDSGEGRKNFDALWRRSFPLVLPPTSEDGLGVILLNSNADTHFSFTNALGMVPLDEVVAVEKILADHPRAGFLIGLHHHLVEYPRPARKISERIGTALINGNWLARRLQKYGDRVIVLHGHRHIDWIGRCGTLRIVSAPSPVMAPDGSPHFYLHRFAMRDGALAMLAPEKISIAV